MDTISLGHEAWKVGERQEKIMQNIMGIKHIEDRWNDNDIMQKMHELIALH